MGRFGSKSLLDGYLQGLGESDSTCGIDNYLTCNCLDTAGAGALAKSIKIAS